MSASSAACAVWCRGSASSSAAAPVIANGRTSRSDSARASARSAAWFAARLRLGGSQVHQRHGTEIAAEGDVRVLLPGYRGVEEPDVLDDAGQVTASPGQRPLP